MRYLKDMALPHMRLYTLYSQNHNRVRINNDVCRHLLQLSQFTVTTVYQYSINMYLEYARK